VSEQLDARGLLYFASLFAAVAIDVVVAALGLRARSMLTLAAALHALAVLAGAALLWFAATSEMRRFGAEHMAIGIYNVVAVPMALLHLATAAAVAIAGWRPRQ
jgi:hypothetical protein